VPVSVFILSYKILFFCYCLCSFNGFCRMTLPIRNSVDQQILFQCFLRYLGMGTGMLNIPPAQIPKKSEAKSTSLQAYYKPRGFQGVETTRFLYDRYIKVVRFSVLRTGRLYPPRNIAGTHFCKRLIRSQGHIAAGSCTSIKNSNDIIGNRTRDLAACTALPQIICATACPQRQQKKNINSAYM
jgi:hypothetical protein